MPLAALKVRLHTFQWLRGLRAFFVMGVIMLVCRLLGLAPAAAALGAFDTLLVDNGGPYRPRLITIITTLTGGSIAYLFGALLPEPLVIVLPVTILICFLVIYARVLSQPWTSASLLILVLYFAGLGGASHTWPLALLAIQMILVGGAWAALLSLLFWPLDPFRPARLAIADCYGTLATITGTLPRNMKNETTSDWRRTQRTLMETARQALSATAARAPSRTIRARNLTVLLETVDLLQARNTRLADLADLALADLAPNNLGSTLIHTRLIELESWLAAAERAIELALLNRPADSAASFSHDGSQRLQFVTRRRAQLTAAPSGSKPILTHVCAEERGALLEIEVAFDAVYALWTGSDTSQKIPAAPPTTLEPTWLESAQSNFTLTSAALRHALRLAIVGGVDVIVMRLIHVNHGFWLPMTSIILMQPYSAGTGRRSLQRITGTVAGGFLAATLAVTLPGPLSLIAAITILSGLTLATYAVDYAIYSFFLTPAFVLLSLPHPHDWRYAGIRIGLTVAGATIAILAMRLLWPERAESELGNLLRRGVLADAAYLRATLKFWEALKPPRPALDSPIVISGSTEAANRRMAERTILAPARRACGLASNDAEEAIDRLMQEPNLGPLGPLHLDPVTPTLRSEALTFATYLRRLTQSITTLAAVGRAAPDLTPRLESLACRLESLPTSAACAPLTTPRNPYPYPYPDPILEEQLQRLDRQTGILERAANLLSHPGSPSS